MADSEGALPTLDEADLAVLEAVGRRRSTAAGEFLFHEGDPGYDFFAVRSGAVEISVRTGEGDRVIARHGPGRFLGELNLLTGTRLTVSARVVEPGEVIQVPRGELRGLLAAHPRLGDTILAAFLARREELITAAASAIRLVGSRFDPETRRLREFLVRNRIGHEWLDPEMDAHVEGALRELGVAAAELPVVIVSGTVLRRPATGELAEYLGMVVADLPHRSFDLVVVGAGPAGLAAAVYGASEGLETLLVDQVAAGGQAGTTSRIENYLGFPTGISGDDLTLRALTQAEKFGAAVTVPCSAASLREEAGHLVVRLSNGTDVAGRAVIAATGAHYRRLASERLADFEGRGVFYAATASEAQVCAPSPVVVVGGGNSAGQAALFLAEAGSPVTVVIRGDDLGASMSRYLVERIEQHPRITVRTGAQVTALDGGEALQAVTISHAGGDSVTPCAGLFSFIGADPAAGWLSGCAELDASGFLLTDRDLSDAQLGERWRVLGRRPLPFETSHPGLFAAGDVRSGSTKRVAAAVGEGSAAVRSVHRYLAFIH
ncbi:MAG TPA: FAD-dependent oxidoreductase [Candidatus Dormibacteraeota bacterium]|nr:FAD-dependent oxidoreductase [Candidatus Dormibacteraeota bacterium]